jgi:2,3-dihydro-2,3-dihydroxybenzoate dehydrogenase
MTFTGKQVWVTGAGSGIGLQVARRFSEFGALVTGFDIAFNDDEHYPFTKVVLDLTEHDSIAYLCDELLLDNVKLDVLVNAAGVLRLGLLESLSVSDWDTCMQVNVSAVFYMLKYLIPHFKAQRGGVIINVASNAAQVPRIKMAAYCASKAALVSLSHCVGLELAGSNVRCNVVSPGSTDTPMLRSMLPTDDAVERTIAGLPEQFKLGIPLGKIGTANDVANAILFLASDQAGHITMQNIVVDGGATLSA